jgi:microsomal dipeptidase-like Zn-dependent dipeptidase
VRHETVHEWSGGSWEHVAIGTDFDGFTDYPDDCDSEAKLPPDPRDAGGQGGLGEDADAVLGANARGVLRDGWQ